MLALSFSNTRKIQSFGCVPPYGRAARDVIDGLLGAGKALAAVMDSGSDWVETSELEALPVRESMRRSPEGHALSTGAAFNRALLETTPELIGHVSIVRDGRLEETAPWELNASTST